MKSRKAAKPARTPRRRRSSARRGKRQPASISVSISRRSRLGHTATYPVGRDDPYPMDELPATPFERGYMV